MPWTIEILDMWHALRSSTWGAWEHWWWHWGPTLRRLSSVLLGRNLPPGFTSIRDSLPPLPPIPKTILIHFLGKCSASPLDLFPQHQKAEKMRKVWRGQSCGPWMVKRWWWTGAGCWPVCCREGAPIALLQFCTIAPLHCCTIALLHYCTIALLHWIEVQIADISAGVEWGLCTHITCHPSPVPFISILPRILFKYKYK